MKNKNKVIDIAAMGERPILIGWPNNPWNRGTSVFVSVTHPDNPADTDTLGFTLEDPVIGKLKTTAIFPEMIGECLPCSHPTTNEYFGRILRLGGPLELRDISIGKEGNFSRPARNTVTNLASGLLIDRIVLYNPKQGSAEYDY